jgi:hypothetical protein
MKNKIFKIQIEGTPAIEIMSSFFLTSFFLLVGIGLLKLGVVKVSLEVKLFVFLNIKAGTFKYPGGKLRVISGIGSPLSSA